MSKMPTPEEITPTSAEKIRDMTRPSKEIPDRRGPLVYDLTETASLNGIDPNFMDKEAID